MAPREGRDAQQLVVHEVLPKLEFLWRIRSTKDITLEVISYSEKEKAKV